VVDDCIAGRRRPAIRRRFFGVGERAVAASTLGNFRPTARPDKSPTGTHGRPTGSDEHEPTGATAAAVAASSSSMRTRRRLQRLPCEFRASRRPISRWLVCLINSMSEAALNVQQSHQSREPISSRQMYANDRSDLSAVGVDAKQAANGRQHLQAEAKTSTFYFTDCD